MSTPVKPAPRTAPSARASTSGGNESTASMRRMTTPSARPPAYPASMPSTPPAMAAMATDTKPATSDTRVPQMTRLNTSRPTLSVPSQCARPGRARLLPRFCASGSYGASSGAASAMTMAASSTAAPNGASRARVARRSASQRRSRTVTASRVTSARSANPDSGIDPAIQQVDEQIAHDEAERDQQDHALDERIVAREDRVDDEPSHARQREDVFRDDGTADQRAELKPEHGHDGDQRILQHMTADDDPLRKALGARRPYVIFGERLEQTGARLARVHRRQRQAERDRRQHERAKARPAFLQRIEIAGDRQPPQRHAEHEDQQQGEQEVRHADAEQRERRARAIDAAVVAHGGDDGDRKGHEHGDAHCEQRQ